MIYLNIDHGFFIGNHIIILKKEKFTSYLPIIIMKKKKKTKPYLPLTKPSYMGLKGASGAKEMKSELACE